MAAPGGADWEIVAGGEPPHSAAAEAILLASVLVDDTPASWSRCCQIGIRPKAFHLAANREIWEAIHALHTRGVAVVDLAVVIEELKVRNSFEEIGGMPYLLQLSAQVKTSLQLRYFAEQVKLLWDRRHAMTLAQEVRAAALEFEGREAFVGTVGDIGQRMIALGKFGEVRSLAEQIDAVQADVTARAEGKEDRTRWISSGLPLFDEKCRPFTGGREDQLVVVAGGSGMGKSVVLRQLAGEALRQNRVVLSFSRETSTAGFIEMLGASWATVDLNNLEREPRDRIARFISECEQMRAKWADRLLFCVEHTPETPLLTVDDLADQVRQFVNLRGQPNLILVDYLQLFGTRKPCRSREETVATVSHRLQAISRELPGTTVLVAAQLNESGLDEMRQIRREERNDGKEGKLIHRMPKPGDLRESQAIYHDADRMIFLYRPPLDCRNVDQRSPHVLKPEVWWYQEKRRRGGVYGVRCWFEKRYTRFIEVARADAEAAEAADAAAGGSVPPGGMSKDDWKRYQP